MAAVVLVSLTATGCASGVGAAKTTDEGAAYEEFAGLTGEERRRTLVAAAEVEGALSLYTSLTEDVLAVLEPAFEEAFDVDVEVYRANSQTVLTKLTQEHQAGAIGADVVESDSLHLMALNSMGILTEYTGERRDQVPEAGQGENWTATRFNVFAPSWNTDRVSADDVPTSWEDLADPKWDGQLALELGDYDWYMALSTYWLEQGKTQEEVDALFGDIVDGGVAYDGHIAMVDRHQSGAFDLAASNYTYIVEQQKRAGAPLEYAPLVEPVFARPNGVGLIAQAEHPAAATLFADWMLEEGQVLLAEKGLTTAIVPDGADDPLQHVDVRYVDDGELLENGPEWEGSYEELLKNAGAQ
ncbi:hypothetical protein ASD19_00245 [Microbacterium sp. Root53]|nr:hypothetical protein ASD19_00245 [Microbacterium sp. Root53]